MDAHGHKRARVETPGSSSSGRVFDDASSDGIENEGEEHAQPIVDYEDFPMSQTDNPHPPSLPAAGTPPLNGRALVPRGFVPEHPKKGKSIHDRVHGTIALDPLLVAVMDTPQFQRLERIHQLGGCSYVYPSAKHSRKEHSIGVAHLAGCLMTHLRAKQPELFITEDDVRCVQLAGLVHDLGHGPYSHMFEGFVNWQGEQERTRAAKLAAGPEREAKHERARKLCEWTHEDMSMALFDLLIDSNEIPLEAYFSNDGCSDVEHRTFVKQLIAGLRPEAPWPDGNGRDEKMRFLFDVVSNSRNGIDVDKLDYLLRDSMACLGSKNIFEVSRLIDSTRVISVKDVKTNRRLSQVCFQMKVAGDIVDIYSIRAKLHRTLYQHHTANVAEMMISDVLKLANEALRFRGADGRATTLADAALDPATFCLLTDAITDCIGLSMDPGIEPAVALLERIHRRDFYKQIGNSYKVTHQPLCTNKGCRRATAIDWRYCPWCDAECSKREHTGRAPDSGQSTEQHPAVVPLMKKTADDFRRDILHLVAAKHKAEVEALADQVQVHLVDITHGKKVGKLDGYGIWWAAYDPLYCVGFYNPKNAGTTFDQVSHVKLDQMSQLSKPEADQERTLWFYCKSNVTLASGASLLDVVATAYGRWVKAQPGVGASVGGQNTPTHTPNGSEIKKPTRQGRLNPARLAIGHSDPVPEEDEEEEGVAPAEEEGGGSLVLVLPGEGGEADEQGDDGDEDLL